MTYVYFQQTFWHRSFCKKYFQKGPKCKNFMIFTRSKSILRIPGGSFGRHAMHAIKADLSDRAYTTNQYNIFLLFSSSGETTSVTTIVIPVVTPKMEDLDECPLFYSLHRI